MYVLDFSTRKNKTAFKFIESAITCPTYNGPRRRLHSTLPMTYVTFLTICYCSRIYRIALQQEKEELVIVQHSIYNICFHSVNIIPVYWKLCDRHQSLYSYLYRDLNAIMSTMTSLLITRPSGDMKKNLGTYVMSYYSIYKVRRGL